MAAPASQGSVSLESGSTRPSARPTVSDLRRSRVQHLLGRVVGVAVLSDLTAFVEDHHAHGQLIGDASEPESRGYRVTVACPCGVTFERWVTELDATDDLLRLALRTA